MYLYVYIIILLISIFILQQIKNSNLEQKIIKLGRNMLDADALLVIVLQNSNLSN